MRRINNNVKYTILSFLMGILSFNSLLVNAQSTKKGLCLGVSTTDFSLKLRLTKSTWHYGWNLRKSSLQPVSVEFVPMIFGNPSASSYTYLDSAYRAGDFTHLLGFNEPDAAEQGNVTVEQAIAAWPNMVNLGIPLGSPAATNAEGVWMTEFMSRANALNYRVDFVTLHWYGGPNAANFLALLNRVYALYNKPIWITEFAIADWSATPSRPNIYSEPQVLDFMKTVLTALETPEYSFVHRFSWFSKTNISPDNTSPLGKSLLFDGDGGLTYLGQYYANHKIATPRVALVNPLIAWNVFGQPSVGAQNIMPTTLNSALETSGFVRGAGVNLTSSTNTNIWGGSGWSTEIIDVGPAISQGKYIDFNISAKANKSFSLSKLGALKIITNSTGPIYFKLQYAIDNGAYKGITTLFVDRPSATTVFFLDDVDLSIFPDLQDVAAGKTVKFRMIPFGATSASTGVFYIGSNVTANNNSNSLGFEGTIKTIQTGATTELASWNFFNQTGGGTQAMAPTFLNSSLNSSGLIKGSGVTNVTATTDRLWGARAWSLDLTGPDAGITGNKFFTFSFTPKADNFVSFTEINPFKIRISSLGPINYSIQYAIGNEAFKDITVLNIIRPSTTSNFTLPVIDISGISELQNVSPNKTVNFRIIPWGATNNEFSHFYLGDLTNVNSFGINGSIANVLPVKLKSFTAKNVNDKVVLKWQTSSEINFSHFIIERKVGNGDFKELSKVKSAGLTSGSNYSFTDDFASFETHYYRLKMIDFDGTIAYSYIQFANLNNFKNQSLSLYPNPAVSEVTVSYPIANPNSRLKIIGIDGKAHADYPLEVGSINKKIDVSDLEKGYYIIIYNNSSSSKGLKFIKN
ncbi:glycosyl hydrolase [Pedobacter cryophilus]|nr:glycosyl hydrolase [Pedobacter cryophilus]